MPDRPWAAIDPIQAAAVALLKLQRDLLQARSQLELAYFFANEPRQILRAQQIVFVARAVRTDFAVRAISSVRTVERASPLVLWFESTVKALDAELGLSEPRQFDAGAFTGDFDAVAASYPLRYLLWVPWRDADGRIDAGLLLARTVPWTRAELSIANHLAGVFLHAWDSASRPIRALSLRRWITPRTAVLAGLIGAALLAVPVPMTALAPAEVAPRDSVVVTSGVEGVVKSVLVDPNQPVRKDQPLLQLVDTTLKNRFEVAEQEVLVAETKYKKAAQLAFVDARGRHELGLAQAELGLKLSERDYARDLLQRAEIKADRDGVAFFADKKDLIGRPVAVGEKLMEIASPTETELRIDLAVGDAIVIRDGARVKVYLDSDPLNPVEARLVRSSYQAKPRDNQQLAFRLVAQADAAQRPAALRLGARGTAQIYSDHVPLGFYLFRRPLSAARQWIGL